MLYSRSLLITCFIYNSVYRVLDIFLKGAGRRGCGRVCLWPTKPKKCTLWPFIEEVFWLLIWGLSSAWLRVTALHVVFSPLSPLTNLSPGFSLSEHLVQEAPITKISPKGQRNEDLFKVKICSSCVFYISFPPFSIKLTEDLVCL